MSTEIGPATFQTMASTSAGYSWSGLTAVSLAEAVRFMGYVAIPCMNETAMSVPLAIDAGLGQLGRLGYLITPWFGPARAHRQGADEHAPDSRLAHRFRRDGILHELRHLRHGVPLGGDLPGYREVLCSAEGRRTLRESGGPQVVHQREALPQVVGGVGGGLLAVHLGLSLHEP